MHQLVMKSENRFWDSQLKKSGSELKRMCVTRQSIGTTAHLHNAATNPSAKECPMQHGQLFPSVPTQLLATFVERKTPELA